MVISDIKGNKLVLDGKSTEPSGSAGEIYYNNSSNEMYYNNGTEWKKW